MWVNSINNSYKTIKWRFILSVSVLYKKLLCYFSSFCVLLILSGFNTLQHTIWSNNQKFQKRRKVNNQRVNQTICKCDDDGRHAGESCSICASVVLVVDLVLRLDSSYIVRWLIINVSTKSSSIWLLSINNQPIHFILRQTS